VYHKNIISLCDIAKTITTEMMIAGQNKASANAMIAAIREVIILI
jgi:hypothetical protein